MKVYRWEEPQMTQVDDKTRFTLIILKKKIF